MSLYCGKVNLFRSSLMSWRLLLTYFSSVSVYGLKYCNLYFPLTKEERGWLIWWTGFQALDSGLWSCYINWKGNLVGSGSNSSLKEVVNNYCTDLVENRHLISYSTGQSSSSFFYFSGFQKRKMSRLFSLLVWHVLNSSWLVF